MWKNVCLIFSTPFANDFFSLFILFGAFVYKLNDKNVNNPVNENVVVRWHTTIKVEPSWYQTVDIKNEAYLQAAGILPLTDKSGKNNQNASILAISNLHTERSISKGKKYVLMLCLRILNSVLDVEGMREIEKKSNIDTTTIQHKRYKLHKYQKHFVACKSKNHFERLPPFMSSSSLSLSLLISTYYSFPFSLLKTLHIFCFCFCVLLNCMQCMRMAKGMNNLKPHTKLTRK